MNANWYFTKKERIGFLSFISLCVLIYIGVRIYTYYNPPPALDFEDIEDFLSGMTMYEPDNKNIANKSYNYKETRNQYANIKRQYFVFDPNTLSFDSLLLLGIHEKAAKNLQNYLAKGGRIRKPEDFMKIWGVRAADSVLLEYIAIKENKNEEKPKASFIETRQLDFVEINGADTFQLQLLPGIGQKLAKRIWQYRERLGGFHDLDQLYEVYGMEAQKVLDIIPFLLLDKDKIRKIKINKVDDKELGKHPHIDFKRAKIVINYRNNHGPYHTAKDLEKIKVLSEDDIERLAPYLDFSE